MTDCCIICGWTLAKNQAGGCIPGDCSYRPDDPAEPAKLKDRREMVRRAQAAVISGWETCQDVPFPLYDREAGVIAEHVIRAIEVRFR